MGGNKWTGDTWRNKDSVWNFHVWNDMWMKRPDLENFDKNACKKKESDKFSFDGWQAVDPTYQEQSDEPNMMNDNDNNKYYQTGPVSVDALLHQCEGISYDFKFILSEVDAVREDVTRDMTQGVPSCNATDADEKCWKGPPSFGASVQNAAIGKKMSTSKVGQPFNVSMITSEYKSPEDTFESIEEFELGESLDENIKKSVQLTFSKLDLTYPGKGVQTGTDLVVTMKAQTPNREAVHVSWEAKVIHYNGHDISDSKGYIMADSAEMDPEAGTFEIKVPSEKYAPLLKYGVTIAIDAVFQTDKTSVGRISDLRVPVTMPKVQLDVVGETIVKRCAGKPKHDQTISFTATVQNPFKELETVASKMTVEIVGMDETSPLESAEWNWDVPAIGSGASWSKTKGEVPVHSLGCGEHDIIATWQLDEFAETTDATGWTSFHIDCSSCSGAETDADESKEERVRGPPVLAPGMEQGANATKHAFFARADTNHDGMLTQSEFMNAKGGPDGGPKTGPTTHGAFNKVGPGLVSPSPYGTPYGSAEGSAFAPLDQVLANVDPYKPYGWDEKKTKVPGHKLVIAHAEQILTDMHQFISQHPLAASVDDPYGDIHDINHLASGSATGSAGDGEDFIAKAPDGRVYTTEEELPIRSESHDEEMKKADDEANEFNKVSEDPEAYGDKIPKAEVPKDVPDDADVYSKAAQDTKPENGKEDENTPVDGSKDEKPKKENAGDKARETYEKSLEVDEKLDEDKKAEFKEVKGDAEKSSGKGSGDGAKKDQSDEDPH